MASFHHLPYKQKQHNPQPHSCARCLNRPVDFCNSNVRVNTARWTLKKGVTNQEMCDAIMADDHELEESLKEYNPCPIDGWSRAAPFYEKESGACKSGKWTDGEGQ